MADGSVTIKVEWDDSDIDKNVKTTQKNIEKKLDDVKVKVDVTADDTSVDELQKSLDKIDDVAVDVDVNVDEAEIEKVQRQLADTTVNFEVKTISDLDEVIKQINTLEGETAKINITASGDELDKVLRQVRQLDGENINIDINVDDSQLNEAEKKISGLGAGIGTAGAIAGIVGITTATQEYNEDLAKLKTNTDLAGESFENANQQLKNLNAITGETDSNVEALSNLMQAGFTGDNLGSAVEQLSGAVIAFPDTLKIEGLSDSLQETIATGKGIGQFSELIERSGQSLEEFDKLLATGKGFETLQAEYDAYIASLGDLESLEVEPPSFDEFVDSMGTITTESERAEIALGYLEDLDFSEVTEQFREQNAEIVANRDAQFELNEAFATIGTELTPVIANVTLLLADMLNWIVQNKDEVLLFASVIGGAVIALKGFMIISTLLPIFSTLISVIKGTTTATAALNAVFNVTPIGLLITAIGALVGAFIYLWNTSDEFRQFWLDVWDNIVMGLTVAKDFIANVVSEIANFFTVTVPNALSIVQQFFANVWADITSVVENAKTAISGVVDSVVNFFTVSIPTALNEFTGFWEEAFSNAIAFITGFPEEVKTIGDNIITGLWNGIQSKIEWIKGKVSGFVNEIKSLFTGITGFDIHSPSKWSAYIMEMVTTGMVNSLDKNGKEVVRTAEEISADIMDALSEWVDDRKFYNELSLEEEIEFWEEAKNIAELGAEEIEEVNKKLYTAEQNLVKQEQELKDEQTKLLQEQQAEYDAIVSKIQSRADELKNSFDLFSELAEKEDVSGRDLLKNLEAQNKEFASWQKNIAELEERGIASALLSELQAKGPQANAEIQALLELDEDDLTKYSELYGNRVAMATEQAMKEVTGASEIEGEIDPMMQSLVETSTNTANEMSTAFTTMFNQLPDLLKVPVNGIIGMINNMINAINWSITELNKVSFSIPSWVPEIGGRYWGFSLPTIQPVPYLAKGGIVTRATQAVVGEAGKEAVLPLENNTGWMDVFADKVASRVGSSGTSQPIIVKIGETELFNIMVNAQNKNNRRVGTKVVTA